MADATPTITHDEDAKRYLIHVDGAEAGFAEYRQKEDGVREFFHTIIHPEHRGKGLSKHLIRHALDHSIASDQKIVPTCDAFEKYITANPDYAECLFRMV